MIKLFPLISLLFLILTCCCKDPENPKKGKSDAVFNPSNNYGTLIDIDGNEYKTITIGTQTWMAENLRTTRYQNGDPILDIKDPSQWGSLTTGAFCTYNNTRNPDSIATFGFLYNGFTIVDNRNIAPKGWHVPTDAEWDSLTLLVAEGVAENSPTGNAVAGGRLKEKGIFHWGYSNQADNESGFTALPAGVRMTQYNEAQWSSEFRFIGDYGAFWSSTPIYDGLWLRSMVHNFGSVGRSQLNLTIGHSVRCIKD